MIRARWGWMRRACVGWLGAAMVVGAVACVEPGGRAPLESTLDPVGAEEEVEIEPSCVPNAGSETDGHDDGHDCDDGSSIDVFCNVVPHPYLYCVSCSDGTSGCYEVPES